MDAVWPREKMPFATLFGAILEREAPTADALFLQPRAGIDLRECSRWMIQRKFDAPRVYAMTPKGGAEAPLSTLDLVPADGDSAFRISVGPGQTDSD
jgi:hypothetical protein